MKVLTIGVICFNVAISGMVLAKSPTSSLSLVQARQIAANYQFPPVERRQKLEGYLHSLSTTELLSLVYSVKAEAILVYLVKESGFDLKGKTLQENSAKVLKNAKARNQLKQYLTSFLLNSASIETSNIK